MPTWNSITKDKDYQSLSLGDRVKTKNEFFRNVISKSRRFKSLPIQGQKELRTDFFTPRQGEGLDPYPIKKGNLFDVARYAHEHFTQKSPFKYLDQPVEQVARFIEPDEAQEGFWGAVKFIPRQMAAETLRAFKPSTYATYYAASKLAKPILRPIGKFAWNKMPERLKQSILRNLTVGKGQPKAYQEAAKETLLARQKGGREAEAVARVLTTAPKDITGVTDQGVKFTIKKGQPIPKEYQRYIGRIFRKEIDIGGRKSFVTLTSEQSARIGKNVEVEVAFSPKVQSLQKDLSAVNRALRDKETLAKG